MPHGMRWSSIWSAEPSAPAATARATKASGSSTNTSIRTVRDPSVAGVAQRSFFGSPRNTGAPATDRPPPPPRSHSTSAPTARPYQAVASVASGTASMTEITGRSVSDTARIIAFAGDAARDATSEAGLTVLHTPPAPAPGHGRNGHATTDDGRLDLDLRIP